MTDKKHPWRPCPLGQHWVREHPRTVPVSEKNPYGKTIVDGHCRNNPSRHEIFVAEEIHKIATEHFKDIKNKPTPDDLGFPKGNAFDDLIAGWTQFWRAWPLIWARRKRNSTAIVSFVVPPQRLLEF